MCRCSLICMIVLMGLPAKAAGGQCSVLSQSSCGQQLISFLRSSMDVSPEQRNPECIEFALRHLEYKATEYKASPETAELVSRYLDFERPLSRAERQGFMIYGPMTEEDMHPAIGTLMSLGKVAIPALLSAIAKPPSTVTARNATHTVMLIFRDQPAKGIELLKQEASISSPSRATKLGEAARKAVLWCSEKDLQQCEAAVGEQ